MTSVSQNTALAVKLGSPSPREASTFHIPSLDGLRAVAFLLVFVSHAGLRVVPGGLGVTIFFFLSGFLICSLLRRELQLAGSISLRNFYLRRALRIGPPLYISLALVISMSLVGMLPGDLKVWPVISEAAFYTNYYLFYGSYPTHIPAGSGVLWSLAVEEHFYLLFPVTLLFLLNSKNRRSCAIILLAACAAVLVWRIILICAFHASGDRTYYCTDTRIDSLLFGCALALYANPAMDPKLILSNRVKIVLYVEIACFLLFSLVWRDEIFRATFRYTVQGVALGSFFYLAIADHQKPWFVWLNWKPIKALGIMTYTMYLIHLSIISCVRWLSPNLGALLIAAIAFAVSLLLASAMYLLVEKPLARWRAKLRRGSLVSSSPLNTHQQIAATL